MEELLCQVQDVYGDECLTVLDFGDGDDEFRPLNASLAIFEILFTHHRLY